MRRTAVVNQIRGLLLERGLPIPKGRSHVDEALLEIQRDASVKLSDAFLILLGQLKVELDQLTAGIEQTVGQIEACQRLTSIPGIGPVTATQPKNGSTAVCDHDC